MICPICKDDLLGRTRCSSYCEGYRDGRDETERRALLERDVAEVERWLPSWSQSVQATIDARVRKGPGDPTNWEAAGNVLRSRIADCRAWLARARAVLG